MDTDQESGPQTGRSFSQGTLHDRVEKALGRRPQQIDPLAGGCVGEVYKALLPGSEPVVVKVDQRPTPQLALEAYMLRYLKSHSGLPVPEVLYGAPDLLILEFLPGSSLFSPQAERHLAELVAELHTVQGPAYGLEKDTLIGLLPQPNGWWDSWVDFFREQRLLFLGRRAVEMGRMPPALLARLERFAAHLEAWITEPSPPSLVHGDLWSANVLAENGRITGVLDPAIYYGDPEVDLAYMQLFHSFREPFFARYHELRPIRPGFWEERRHVYNLYPLLSHVCHFGGHYVAAVSDNLNRFGY